MSSVTPRPSDGDVAQPYMKIPSHPFPGSFPYLTSPTWLPDGRRIVTGTASDVVIWNVANRKQEGKPLQHGGTLSDVVVNRDGKKIISASLEGSIKVWDVESQKLLEVWDHPAKNFSIAVSPDGQLVAADGHTVLIYTAKGTIKRSITPTWPANYVSFSPGGDKLACCTFGGISVYDIDSGTLVLATLPVTQGWIESLLWSYDGSWLFSRSGPFIRCWDAGTGEQIRQPWRGCDPDQQVTFFSLSPDGSIVANTTRDHSLQEDYTLRFWDTSGNLIGQPLRIKERSTGLCFSPSGGFVATTTIKEIHVWQVPTTVGKFSLNASVPPAPDLTPYISKEYNQLVSGGSFGDVYRSWCYHGSRKEVAVKALRFGFVNEDTTINGPHKMLRRELGIWRRLDHPNVVPFLGIAYGFGMIGAMSLVSLWMPNGSLHSFLERYKDKLGVDHRLQFLLDAANGLNYLHSLSVVHGDFNCNNILLDQDYAARIADFGFASLVGNTPEALSYLQRSTSRSGALRWVAPEQIDPERGFDRTTKSDIFSFGCVSVLSGEQPWSEVQQDMAIVVCLMRGQTPRRPDCQTLHDSHWSLIQQCWLPIEMRPDAKAIVSFIQQFLNSCPQSQPLQATLQSSRSDSNTRSSLTQSTLGFSSLPSFRPPVTQFPLYSRNNDQSAFLDPNRILDELLGGNSPPNQNPFGPGALENLSISSVAFSGGSKFLRTTESQYNIEVLKAWRGITEDPHFRDADINELCTEFVHQARHDGTKVVLEPRGLQQLYEKFRNDNRKPMKDPPILHPSPFTNPPNPLVRKTADVSGDIVACQGSKFPRTQESPDNIEALKAWRYITQNPHFRDADINELCSEFAKKARCDGTKVVLEPEGVQQLFEKFKKLPERILTQQPPGRLSS